MSSWEGSACYPQRTFYPMSDGPSIRNHRITISYFRTCLACRPHSQARLCYCALRTVTKRTERTFESLRYPFGGDHPSQTTHQTMFFPKEVRLQISKGWYFTFRLHNGWRHCFKASHLFYTSLTRSQC